MNIAVALIRGAVSAKMAMGLAKQNNSKTLFTDPLKTLMLHKNNNSTFNTPAFAK